MKHFKIKSFFHELCFLFVFFGITSFAEENRQIWLKDFRQISRSLSEATMIPESNANVSLVYQNLIFSLSQSGSPDEITMPWVFSQLGLMGVYCGEMVEKDAAQSDVKLRYLHQTINFKNQVKDLSIEQLQNVLNEYATIFWLRKMSDEEMQVILGTIRQIQSRIPSEVNLKQFLSVACELTAMGFDFILI